MNQIKIKISIFISFILINFFVSVNSKNNQQFHSTSICTKQNQRKCLQWSTTIQYHDNSSACFPQNIAVVGREGNILMKDLRIGEQILTYHQQQGPRFQKMTAWLHRDSKKQISYQKIYTETNNFIMISPMHNIAISNPQKDGFNYQYASIVKSGQILFALSSNNNQLKVKSNQNGIKQKGVYAPYTKIGNFFIVSIRQNAQDNQNTNQYILVHCLAHVPAYYHAIFHYIMSASEWFPVNRNNIQQKQQKYIDPVCHLLSYIYPWAAHDYYDDYDFRYYSMSDHQPNAQDGKQIFGIILDMMINPIENP